jgi:sugar/nucleoside kinase (ribokinase family)
VLIGPASVDRFLDRGDSVPGGGALNMAYHWSQLGKSCVFVTRVARDDETMFRGFFDRHGIATTSAMSMVGESCTVDVIIQDDRQPWMDNFVEGVWSDFSLSDEEVELVASGQPAHAVLVDVVDRELLRLADEGRLAEACLTGDFLSFRHFTPERFAHSFEHLDVGFIGWPGDASDPLVDHLGAMAGPFGNVLVVTFGSDGVRAFDGRSGHVDRQWFDVEARPVVGTTLGCGDSFIAAFLADWHEHGDVAQAVEAGKVLGAAATGWERALPPSAYA